jgi:lipoprotein-anchoring transpeptidase ErfK/SrfK
MSTARDVTAKVSRPDVVASAGAGGRGRHRRGPLFAGLALLLLVAIAAGVAALAGAFSGGDDAAAPHRTFTITRAAAGLPAAPPSGLRVSRPARLSRTQQGTATWAALLRATTARREPSATAPAVARIPAATPEGTDTIVRVLGRRRGADGELWTRVSLAIAPNGSTGWVPRSALGALHAADAHLIVDRAQRLATLVRDGRVLLRVPVGVGAAATPTPAGEFYVRSRLGGYDDPSYGPAAFGTSARSAGGGYVGIQGTDRPDLLPGAVSGGSVLLRDADITRLYRLMRAGTPVTIR